MGTDLDKVREEGFDIDEEISQTLKRASAFVAKKEFPRPKHWSAEELDQLEYPSDLTQLSFDELGRQMGLWTSVIAYTQYQTAMAEVEHTAKFNKLEYEKKKMELELLEGEKRSDSERQAIIKTDNGIKRLQADFETAKARYALLKALLSSYSKYYTSFSRELSRREVAGDRPPVYSSEEDVDLSDGRNKGKRLFAVSEERRRNESDGGDDDGDVSGSD